ncbi:hypothetical protein WJX81_008001 [Elliptochloris bilobata]|uniref:Uncharacterized protein n=1 Tax=Elliptochloris bilobata TaxID=381761 RepID=A0AAW1RDG2_9CHLO
MRRKRAERSASGGAVGGNPNPYPGAAHERPALPWLRPGFDAAADRGRWGGAPADDTSNYGSAFSAPVQSPYERIVRVAGAAAGAAAQHLYKAATGERRLPASLQAAGRVIMNGFAGSSGGGGGAGRPLAHPTHSEADVQAALRAAVESLEMCGEGEREPPRGLMTTPLMRHQRLALDWMLRREAPRARPVGGILADDQGLGKTVSLIALLLSNKPLYFDAARRGTPHAEPQSASSSSDSSSTSDLDPSRNPSRNPSCGPPDRAGTSSTADSACTSAEASVGRSGGGGGACSSGGGGGGGGGGGSAGAAQEPQMAHPGEERLWAPGTDRRGGTLVVCPTSVLRQWEREIAAKVAHSAGLTVHVYHGKARAETAADLARYGVVLTTYATMALEAPSRPDAKSGTSAATPIDLCESSSDSGEDGAAAAPAGAKGGARRRRRRRRDGPLFSVQWFRVVLDEAQSIKNSRTLASHASWSLQATRRWCLTGTPIQNSIDDLYSYFRFLKYEPYSKHAAFKTLLKEPLQSSPALGTKRLRTVLQGMLLRRTKATRIDGQPVVDLPERRVLLQRIAFSPPERAFYDCLQKESASQLKALEAGTGGGNPSYVNMLWLLLRMRQACSHPWLVKGAAAKFGTTVGAGAAELAAAAKLAPDARGALLATLEAGGSACAQCGDLPEDPLVAVCAHLFCRQCIAVQVGAPGSAGASEQSFECPACRQPLAASQVFSAAALRGCRAAAPGSAKSSSPGPGGRPGDAGPGAGGALPRNGALEAKGAGAGPPAWQTSAKVEFLLRMLGELRERNAAAAQRGMAVAPEKAIVFSQWTGMLDLVEAALGRAGLRSRRLDGSMSISAREAAIASFQSKSGADVLLVSLKAAALGLNLTAANHVVLLDLWWNPTTEEQAIDRAHRIGQARAVHVTRITIEGTVEDKILQLQERKRAMAETALGDSDGGLRAAAGRLTMQDLHFLFSGM